MALNSMRTAQQFEVNPFALPTHWSLSSYSMLSRRCRSSRASCTRCSSWCRRSSCHLRLVTGGLCLYQVPVKLGNVLFWTMLMIMFMPGVVVLLPLYVEVARTGLANNFAPAILIYTAINIPYGTYLLRSNFRAIPDSVVEAARVDGASWIKVYWRVIVPIGKPGMITVGILTFLNIWNDLFISLVLLPRAQYRDGDADVGPTEREVHLGHTGLNGRSALGGATHPALIRGDRSSFIRGMLSGAVR